MRTWADLDEFQAFLDDGGMVEADDDMPEEYRQEVFRFIEFHANSELMGGLTERDWIPHSPGLRLKQIFLRRPKTKSDTPICCTWLPRTWASKPVMR